MTLHALDPIKAARQQESMENARRRLQEKQDAKAAKFMEDQKLASIIIISNSKPPLVLYIFPL